MNVNHIDLVQLRQRAADLKRTELEHQKKDIGFRSFIAGLAAKYGVDGLRYRFNIDTGEIEIFPDAYPKSYTLLSHFLVTEHLDLITEPPNPVPNPDPDKLPQQVATP